MSLYLVAYLGIAFLLILLTSWLAAHQQSRLLAGHRFIRQDYWFLGLLLLTFAWLRLPGILYNVELNPDESQVIANAMTLDRDPIYQRSVDGTTVGPINSYLLLLPNSLGLPFDYTSARLVGLLLLLSAVGFFYASLREVVSSNVARIISMACAAFWGFNRTPDFMYYSSELPSLPAITASVWMAFRLFRTGRYRTLTLFCIGLLTGLLLYAKLQPMPILVVISGVTALYIVVESGWQRAIGPVSLLVVGGCLPSLLIFGIAAYYGLAGEFFTHYYLVSLETYSQIYADTPLVQASIWTRLADLPVFISRYANTLVFVSGGLVLLSIGLLGSPRAGLRQRLLALPRWPVMLMISVLAAAWLAVMAPGTEFGHHLQLLVFPVGWFFGYIMSLLSQRFLKSWRPVIALGLLILITQGLIVAKPMVYAAPPNMSPAVTPGTLAGRWLYHTNPYLYFYPRFRQVSPSPTAVVARGYSRPGDKLVVWGWSCQYHLETGLSQGARDACFQRAVVPNVRQQQILTRYANDIRQNKPALFIDATEERFGKEWRHDRYPMIANVVDQYYQQVDSLAGARVFVLRSRLTK